MTMPPFLPPQQELFANPTLIPQQQHMFPYNQILDDESTSSEQQQQLFRRVSGPN